MTTPKSDRCEFCSFDPTNAEDYCEDHRPVKCPAILADGKLLKRVMDSRQYTDSPFVRELVVRYENKKDECEELRNAHYEVLQELDNKKKECEDLKKLGEQRIRRQVQLHSRNLELKEKIDRVLMILDPQNYQGS